LKNISKVREVQNAHKGGVSSLRYMPESRELLSGGGDGIVRLWKKGLFGSFGSTDFYGHKGLVLDISCFSDGSKFVSSATEGQIILWDVKSRKNQASVNSFKQFPNNLEVDPGQWAFMSAACVPHIHKVIVLHAQYGLFIWNLQVGHIADFPSSELPLFGTRVVLAEQRDLIITNSGKSIYILNMNNGGIIRVFGGSPKGVRKGTQMIFLGEEDEVMSKTFENMGGHKADVTCLAISTDERFVISGSHDCTIRRWNISDPSNIEPKGVKIMVGHRGLITDVSFLPNTNVVASCSVDGSLRLWDSEKCEELFLTNLSTPLYAMAISSDGQELAVGGDNGSMYFFSL
jgi:WD40 repeat protein